MLLVPSSSRASSWLSDRTVRYRIAKMTGRQSGTDRSDENTIEQGNDSTPRERERVSREQYLVPSSHRNSLLAILSRLSFEPP